MPFRCFDVPMRYFEEILLDLKNDKKQKELIMHIECSDALVEGE